MMKTKSNEDLRVNSSDVQIVESVIRYNAFSFTGTVVGNQACNMEYEVVDGLKNGYIESIMRQESKTRGFI